MNPVLRKAGSDDASGVTDGVVVVKWAFNVDADAAVFIIFIAEPSMSI